MKLYFCKDIDERICSTKDYWLCEMETETVVLINAIRVNIADSFFCQYSNDVGEKGDCGKFCDVYQPRNGKSGCCKHHGFLYEQGTESYILYKNGKLKKMK